MARSVHQDQTAMGWWSAPVHCSLSEARLLGPQRVGVSKHRQPDRRTPGNDLACCVCDIGQSLECLHDRDVTRVVHDRGSRVRDEVELSDRHPVGRTAIQLSQRGCCAAAELHPRKCLPVVVERGRAVVSD